MTVEGDPRHWWTVVYVLLNIVVDPYFVLLRNGIIQLFSLLSIFSG